MNESYLLFIAGVGMGEEERIEPVNTELPPLQPLSIEPLDHEAIVLAEQVRSLAQRYAGQSLELLSLLRLLEALHREIRDGLFQDSLPDNRQALYALLRDIEASGGWPYIYRPKLHAFLSAWEANEMGKIDGDNRTGEPPSHQN